MQEARRTWADYVRVVMRSCEVRRERGMGRAGTEEDAASLVCPAPSLQGQQAVVMVAFVEWWHVRLRARVVCGLAALARRSTPLPLCLMAIVGSYCGCGRCCDCSRGCAYTCEGCQSSYCGVCWYWGCWRCWTPAASRAEALARVGALTAKPLARCELVQALQEGLRALQPKSSAGSALWLARKAELRALRQKPPGCAMERSRALRELRAMAKPLPRCRCEEWAHMGWQCFYRQ